MKRLRSPDERGLTILVNGSAFALTLPYVYLEHALQLGVFPGISGAPWRFGAEMATYAIGLAGHVALYLAYAASSHAALKRGLFLSSQAFTMGTTILFFSLRAPAVLFLVCWPLGVLGLWSNSIQFADRYYRTIVHVWIGVAFIVSGVVIYRTGHYYHLLSNLVICLATYPVMKFLETKKKSLESRVEAFRDELSAIAFANSIICHDIRNDVALVQMAAALVEGGVAPRKRQEIIESRCSRILQTLALLRSTESTCFDVYPVLANLAAKNPNAGFVIDENLKGWQVFFNFYLFCRIVENLVENSIEAHRRRFRPAPMVVRFYLQDERLCVHDNCGGLTFPHEALGKRSEKGHGFEHFTDVLLGWARALQYEVEFDTIDDGLRVAVAFPRPKAESFDGPVA